MLELFGSRYIEEYLDVWIKKRSALKNDWFKALDFFLSHVYLQGRADELSDRYYKAAKKVLLKYFGTSASTQIRRYNHAWKMGFIPNNSNWNDHIKRNTNLWLELERAKAGKTRDMEMVLDVLRFIHSCPSHNIVQYSLKEIKHGRTGKLYSEIDSIWQVGQKTASFYLRDLAFLYDLKLSPKDYSVIQPIDTWVYQVFNRIGIFSDGDSNKDIIEKLLRSCESARTDPKKVNAGAWYLGANSFDILLDHILSGGNIIQET